MSILFGGFMGIGTPDGIVREILASGVKDLTIIGNDTAMADTGIGILVGNRRVKKVIATHIGTNPETGRQMIAGELDVLTDAAGHAGRAHPLRRSGSGRRADADRCRHRSSRRERPS